MKSWPQYLQDLHQVGSVGLDSAQLTGLFSSLISTIQSGDGIVFTAGNGGSASTAEHFAADLSQLNKRTGINCKSICLNSNVALNSALANDLSFAETLTYQFSTLVNKNSLLITFSASGNSENLLRLHEFASKLEISTWALIGFDGGKTLELYSQQCVTFKTEVGLYGVVENLHLAAAHFLIDKLTETFGLSK